MISLLKHLLLDNWLRKLLSLILAIIIWMAVSSYMTSTKVIQNVPIRVIHMPEGKTIEGMQASGLLHDRITLSLQGNKTTLDTISEKDLEIVLDAKGKPNEWVATIGRNEIVSLNPDFVPSKAIFQVTAAEIPIKQSNFITEKVPITVTPPIGEAPRGYQYLDIFPYQLFVTVSGPEEEVKRLKYRGGLKLTFNLNDISKAELDTLQTIKQKDEGDEINYFVPNAWKKITIPSISDMPLEIDDPRAKALRIDFSYQDLLPIGTQIPVTVFFPPKYAHLINPKNYTLAVNDFIIEKNGVKVISAPLCAQGVSQRFLNLVQNMIQVVIIATPKSEGESPLWSVQFVYPHELEDRFVAMILSESGDEIKDVLPHLKEDFLRNRFRNYMNHFRLYTPNNQKLRLKFELHGNMISATAANL